MVHHLVMTVMGGTNVRSLSFIVLAQELIHAYGIVTGTFLTERTSGGYRLDNHQAIGLYGQARIIRTYHYDAFGVQENIDPDDTNPWRYRGELRISQYEVEAPLF